MLALHAFDTDKSITARAAASFAQNQVVFILRKPLMPRKLCTIPRKKF